MSTLILTDLHGNLPALEAILATAEARSCREIVSLGDHVNFGPQSRAVHDRLVQLGATLLLGNHEERLRHPDDPDFAGYNWAMMRWTAQQMQGANLDLPTDVQRGHVLMTHGTPGDPYHLVQPHELPNLLDELPAGVTLLLSGHNHRRWEVAHNGRRAVNPGSSGMGEDGRGCIAAFALLDGDTVIRCETRYDIRDVLRGYLDTGAWRIAPELCRAVVRTMRTGEYQGVTKLLRHVNATCHKQKLDFSAIEAWQAADATYAWEEPLPSPEYWNMIERSL